MTLPVTLVAPSSLYRVSQSPVNEPHFGSRGTNRFDAPGCAAGQPQYRSFYAGQSLAVAVAESVLHDAMPEHGLYRIASLSLERRHLHRYSGSKLRVIDLSGALLKSLGGHADLSATADYATTQQWALAVFRHPLQFDGIRYMSRHMTDGYAVMLFDRAGSKLKARRKSVRLIDAAGFAELARLLRIAPA